MMAMMAKVMGGMIGETLTLVMAPDGNLKSIQGGDAMMAKVKEDHATWMRQLAGVDVDHRMLGRCIWPQRAR